MSKLIKLLVLFLFCFTSLYGQSEENDRTSSWKEILAIKKGTLVCYWHDAEPFVYLDEGKLKGIEVELIKGFVNYLENKHEVDIVIDWKQANTFDAFLNSIIREPSSFFGISSLSYTEERAKKVNFSPPYMPDISVIITSSDVPLFKSMEEFNETIPSLTAYTIYGSTFEKMLGNVKNTNKISFELNYLKSIGSMLETIATTPKSFAYTDLPVYLKALERNVPIKRQLFGANKAEGYSFIFPKNSDWQAPVEDYFSNQQFQQDRTKIMNEFFSSDVNNLILSMSKGENISSSEEVIILSKEREMQNDELLHAMVQAERDKFLRNILIASVFIGLLIVLLLLSRFRLKENANKAMAKYQKEIEKRNKELLLLNKEKNDLIHIVSHDLQSPLSQISGMINIIQLDDNELSNKQSEIINKIISISGQMKKMLNKILDVEAIEGSKENLTIEVLNLSEVIDAVVENFAHEAKNKKISLSVNEEKNLPTILADKTLTEQIFQNLISNALKFSEENTAINIRLRVKDKFVEIIISDQGPGISPEEIPYLFKKFKKLSIKPTGGESTTGLGLSIVKKYTEVMGGKVRCESILNKGSDFIVNLKIA